MKPMAWIYRGRDGAQEVSLLKKKIFLPFKCRIILYFVEFAEIIIIGNFKAFNRGK